MVWSWSTASRLARGFCPVTASPPPWNSSSSAYCSPVMPYVFSTRAAWAFLDAHVLHLGPRIMSG